MTRRTTMEVSCRCGAPLARYRKGGKGRLVKMYFDKIVVDHAGVFTVEPRPALHDQIHCPACERRVATVQIVRGRYAAKVNHGAVRTPSR